MSNRNNSGRELLANTMVFGFGTILSKLIFIILLPVYTTYLTASEYGAGELVMNCLNFIFPLTSLSILSALLRFGMDKKKDLNKVLQSTLYVILIGFFVAAALITTIQFNSSINEWKGYLIILLFSYSLNQILSVMSKAVDKTIICAVGGILGAFILLISSIVFVVCLKRGTAGYLESQIVSFFVSFCYLFHALKISKYLTFSRPDKSLLKEMVLFSVPLVFNAIAWGISNFFDRFIIEQYNSTNEVGLYSIASKIPTALGTLGAIFMNAWVLSSIKSYQESEEQNSYFISSVFSKFHGTMLCGASILILLTNLIMSLFTNGSYFESWKYVPLLVCAAVFSNVGNFFAAIYTAAMKNKSIMTTTIIGAVINIVLNLLLIPRYSIQGAVIATMASHAVIAIYRQLTVQQFCQLKINHFISITSLFLLVIESVFVITNKIVYAVLICLICLLLCHQTLRFMYNTGLQNIRTIIGKIK